MTNQPNQPEDTPRINVTVQGPWGGQDVKEIKADTNRKSPATRFRHGWNELLDLPPSAADTLLQASCFIGLGAFPVSVLMSIPPNLDTAIFLAVILPVFLAIAALVYVAALAALENPQLKSALVYRAVLMAIGAMLGGVIL